MNEQLLDKNLRKALVNVAWRKYQPLKQLDKLEAIAYFINGYHYLVEAENKPASKDLAFQCVIGGYPSLVGGLAIYHNIGILDKDKEIYYKMNFQTELLSTVHLVAKDAAYFRFELVEKDKPLNWFQKFMGKSNWDEEKSKISPIMKYGGIKCDINEKIQLETNQKINALYAEDKEWEIIKEFIQRGAK